MFLTELLHTLLITALTCWSKMRLTDAVVVVEMVVAVVVVALSSNLPDNIPAVICNLTKKYPGVLRRRRLNVEMLEIWRSTSSVEVKR